MKKFISNGAELHLRVTDETEEHYICGDIWFSKSDVIVDHHPLDDMGDRLHLHVIPFYNY